MEPYKGYVRLRCFRCIPQSMAAVPNKEIIETRTLKETGLWPSVSGHG